MPHLTVRKHRPLRSLSLCAFGCLMLGALWPATSAVAQGDVLYGALVLATNSEHPAAPPEALQAQAENLKTVFGYNEFRLLGQRRKVVTTGTEDWLVSSRQFFLRVNTEHPEPDGYALRLELLRDNRVLVGAECTLHRSQPLFIRGPFVGQGQLIILLMVL